MQLKVVLPSGEVNVPVEPNSTPGMLKENLKYSIRLPPKFIKLTCNGKELDDIKPLAGEPNNVADGATLECTAKEGHEVEAAEAAKAAEAAARPPVMIKKEEPAKPKKPKKDVIRPELADGDVKKNKVVEPGYQKPEWKKAYLEAKSDKRHLVWLRLEAPEEKTSYPEPEQDSVVALVLGDPHTSPVWGAAAMQMEVGEKADFTIKKKAIDFDPEGLNPTDDTSHWIVELLRVFEVTDVCQDFSQVLHVEKSGGKEKAQDLDNVAVHWRVRRWMAEGCDTIASSRERIAIMPGYGLVPIEDQNAPPVHISVGEGQQEAVEIIAAAVGAGGIGHLYLKSEALRHNRPQGCVVMDVELVGLDSCRGPGSPGWKGWSSLVNERETGDRWLEEADGRSKDLETFLTLRKSTGDSKGKEAAVADQVHKCSNNAIRRYRRALPWLEAEKKDDRKIQLEKATVQMRLAKASALFHQRFGDAAEENMPESEKKALDEARQLLKDVLEASESLANENLKYECLRLTLQVCIQASDVTEARSVLDAATKLRPDDTELKSDAARINRMEGRENLKKGAAGIEEVQKELQAAVATGLEEKPKITELLGKIFDMIKGGEVTWDTVRTLKVGKDVGNAMKMGDVELQKAGSKIVQEIQGLAQRAGIGL